MVRCPVPLRISYLSASNHQGTCPASLLRADSPRGRGVYPQRLFSLVVLRWLPAGREAARRRCPSHFQAVGHWSNLQYRPTSGAWLSFHKRRSRNSSPSYTLDISCSVCLFCCTRFLQYLNVYSRTLEPGSSFSFQLTEDQGAALVTKHLTRCEDVQLNGNSIKYTKDHYDSWVTFARETGHGDEIKPVLVTGVDMTRDFAMMAYSNSDDRLTSEFTTSAPGVGSVWGTWRTSGSVHTNCGPYLSHPPSTSSGTGLAEAAPDEDNQCVFVRHYTVRKRLGIPKVIKAAAGPHDLGPGARDNEGRPMIFIKECDSDSNSDDVSSLFDDGDYGDRSSVTSTESESDLVIHNTTPVCFFSMPSRSFHPF